MKTLRLLLLGVIISCLYQSAIAESGITLSTMNNTYSGQTTIILTVDVEYTIIIPPNLPLAYGAEQTELPFQIHDLNLTKNAALSVSVEEPTGKLQQKNGEGMIPYTLTDENGTFHEKEFTKTGTYPLTVNVDPEAWYAAPAGEYDGTITFKVSVKAKEGGE